LTLFLSVWLGPDPENLLKTVPDPDNLLKTGPDPENLLGLGGVIGVRTFWLSVQHPLDVFLKRMNYTRVIKCSIFIIT
jgi:hypothetical protein